MSKPIQVHVLSFAAISVVIVSAVCLSACNQSPSPSNTTVTTEASHQATTTTTYAQQSSSHAVSTTTLSQFAENSTSQTSAVLSTSTTSAISTKTQTISSTANTTSFKTEGSTTTTTTPPSTTTTFFDITKLTYESYIAMDSDRQREIIDMFSSPQDFVRWYNAVKALYEAAHPDIEIGDDPFDLGTLTTKK